MKTYNVSKMNLAILWIVFVISIILGIFKIIISDKGSTTLGVLCKIIFFITIAIPVMKLIIIYHRYFINYIFCVPNTWWIKEVERPRLFFNILGILIVTFSLILLSAFHHNDTMISYIIDITFSLTIYLLGLLFIVIPWIDFFEKTLLVRVREKLQGLGKIQCIMNTKEYNIIKILSAFDDKFKTTPEIFRAVIELKHIEPDERIKTNYSKSDLIRFAYIFFNLTNEKPMVKKQLINTYFLDNEGKEYIQEGESLFARIDVEVRDNNDTYKKIKDVLMSIIEGNKI